MARPAPFDQMLSWAENRAVVLPDVYYGKLQGFARSTSFSVAGITSITQLQGTLDSLNDAMADGKTFSNWKADVRANKVNLDLPDHRLETIFRTNIQGQFARGRCEQQKIALNSRPYFVYDATNDSRTRPAHAAMDGYTALYSDPIWNIWTPLCGYNCRCKRISVTRKQADRFTKADNKKHDDPIVAAERQAAIMTGPDKGWNYNPCEEPTHGVDKSIDDTKDRASPTFHDELDKLKVPYDPPDPSYGHPGGPPLWSGPLPDNAVDIQKRGRSRVRTAANKLDAALRSAANVTASKGYKDALQVEADEIARAEKLADNLSKVEKAADRKPIETKIAAARKDILSARASSSAMLEGARNEVKAATAKIRADLRARQKDAAIATGTLPPKQLAEEILNVATYSVLFGDGNVEEMPKAQSDFIRWGFTRYSELFGVETEVNNFVSTEKGYVDFESKTIGVDAKHRKSLSDIFHLLGHFAEARLGVNDAAKEFVKSKARNNDQRELKDITGSKYYDPNLMAYEGHYISPYIGHIREGLPGTVGYATELISTAAQLFAVDSDLVSAFIFDREYIEFFIGALSA